MEREGLKPGQVGSVRGLADRQLRVPDKPLDSSNRRVSILVKSPLLAASEVAHAPTTTPSEAAAASGPAPEAPGVKPS